MELSLLSLCSQNNFFTGKDIAQTQQKKTFMGKGPEISGIDFFILPSLGHTATLGLYRSATTTCAHLKHPGNPICS